MVHPNVDPSDQIFLRDILSIEKLVKVDRRRAGQVEVPGAARRRLCFLATRNSKIVSRPVDVLEHALGTHDGLRCTVNVCPKKRSGVQCLRHELANIQDGSHNP